MNWTAPFIALYCVGPEWNSNDSQSDGDTDNCAHHVHISITNESAK